MSDHDEVSPESEAAGLTVIMPLSYNKTLAYRYTKNNYGTRSYHTNYLHNVADDEIWIDEIYTPEKTIIVDSVDGSDSWNHFNIHLKKCEPLKIVNWDSLIYDMGVDTARSYLDGDGKLNSSFTSLVQSMPTEALDTIVTVQAKPMMGWSPCRLCSDTSDRGGSYIRAQPTEEETKRHNFHLSDSKLTVAPYDAGYDKNLFLGQGDQITATKRLRDVLIDNTIQAEEVRMCVAQVNIYSKEESNTTARVNRSGRVVIEKQNQSHEVSPLAALLPWIRVPSFLFPNTGIEIQEINFWGCVEQCKTNTHYDGHHNLLLVLHGTKTVELSPPGEIRGSPLHGQHANHPFIFQCKEVGGNLCSSDENEFYSHYLEENDASNNIVVSVTAGEAVFIPVGWWHRVESSEQCMAINIWFDHTSSSISCNNAHQLPYQAREVVRQYIDANIDDVNKSRRKGLFKDLLAELGYNWKLVRWKDPGPIRDLFHTISQPTLTHGQTSSSVALRQRTNEEIVDSMAIIERYGSHLLGVSAGVNKGNVQPLRHLLLPHATKYFGLMISLFITSVNPSIQRDRIALMALFRLPPVKTHHQRQIFTSIVTSITQGACHVLSCAWETHENCIEVEASYNSIFNRCINDEGRKHFTREVDAFRNESSKRLILGDLMMLNPS